MRTYFRLFFFISVCLFLCCNQAPHHQDNPKIVVPSKTVRHQTARQIIDSLHIPANKITIFVDKSDYLLSLIYNKDTLKKYPVVFGPNSSDDKLRAGDYCTPEGVFGIRQKYPHNKWCRFIWIDYPNKESWEKHKMAKKRHLIPKDARIGGEVGIHGVPDGKDWYIDKRNNWTLGCISLKNSDIKEVYEVIDSHNKIVIQK